MNWTFLELLPFQAALWDNCELLEDLLHGDLRTYINSHDIQGRTPLHAAAVNKKSKCLGLLLRFGGECWFCSFSKNYEVFQPMLMLAVGQKVKCGYVCVCFFFV